MTTETLRLTVSATTPVGISHSVTLTSSTVPTKRELERVQLELA